MNKELLNDKTFIQSIVDEYSDAGRAEKIDDVTLQSIDGENKVEFEPINDDSGMEAGVRVYSNGVEVGEFLYEDQQTFVKEFVKTLNYELNL